MKNLPLCEVDAVEIIEAARLNEKRTEMSDSSISGLSIRCNNRYASWTVRYFVKEGGQWKGRRKKVGEYPAISLCEARRLAADFKSRKQMADARQMIIDNSADEIEIRNALRLIDDERVKNELIEISDSIHLLVQRRKDIIEGCKK